MGGMMLVYNVERAGAFGTGSQCIREPPAELDQWHQLPAMYSVPDLS